MAKAAQHPNTNIFISSVPGMFSGQLRTADYVPRVRFLEKRRIPTVFSISYLNFWKLSNVELAQYCCSTHHPIHL